MTWKAISESHTNGILRGYVVMIGDTGKDLFGCNQTLTGKIQGLEKSKVYKIAVAGYTSQGFGNFSVDVIAVTNIDGRLSLKGHSLLA